MFSRSQNDSRGNELDSCLSGVTAIERCDRILEQTGFPDLRRVSQQIEAYALALLLKGAERVGLTLLYSGYDGACSVARGCAIPGSDLDHWIVLVQDRQVAPKKLFGLFERVSSRQLEVGEDAKIDALKKYINRSMNGELLVSQNPLTIIGKSAFERAAYELSYPKDDARPFEERELEELVVSLVTGRSLQPLNESLIEAFAEKYSWFNHRLQSAKISGTQFSLPTKFKHQAREQLVNLFSELSLAEKMLVLEIFDTPVEDRALARLLQASESSPWQQERESLVKRGLLIKLDPDSDRVKAAFKTVNLYATWGMRLEIAGFAGMRYIAPWKMSFAEELLVMEAQSPGAFIGLLEGLSNDSDAILLLPRHLRGLVRQYRSPESRAKTEKFVQKMLRQSFAQGDHHC